MTIRAAAAEDAPEGISGASCVPVEPITALDRPLEPAPETEQVACARLLQIRKAFGPTLANAGIDLLVAPGEVLGLVGGNGAGKSTLMRILCGITTPDAGTIEIDGETIDASTYDTVAAQSRGVRIVHQELSLCANLSVAENFFLEMPELARPLPGWRGLFRERAREALDEVFPNHGIDVDRAVARLPIGQRQMVEIARAMTAPGARLIILDEPTSSLGLERSRQLRAFIRARTERGLSFIFISHKLQEVVEVATRILVLRNGRMAWTGVATGTTVATLVHAMGGASEGALRARRDAPAGTSERPERVWIAHSVAAGSGEDIVLRAGEVVGVAGLEGSGQRELLHRIFAGGGDGVRRNGAASFVSGDRQREGIFPLWDVLSNIAIGRLGSRWPLGIFSAIAERDRARAVAEPLKLDAGRLTSPILEFSGGNQQKALVGRALVNEADIILFDDPTRGIDVAAKEDFYRLVGGMAQAGRLVVWHSTEDVEFLECDRVFVLAGGRVVCELNGDAITEQAIVDASFLRPEERQGGSVASGRGAAERIVSLAPFISGAAVLGTLAWINPLAVSLFGLDLLLGPAIALVLVALAQMFIVGGSEIDLGVGAFAGLVNVLSATLLVDQWPLGLLCLLGAIAGYGLIGATIQVRRIPAIVVTLGAAFIWTGVGYTLQPTPGGSSPHWLTAAFAWQLAGVPATLLLIALAGMTAAAIDRSPLGVVLRGFGNNPGAMERAGWSPLRYGVVRYMIAGGFALAAGLSLTAINTASDVNAGGPFTLISVAAVVMGGCALLGGLISPFGVVVGALTLALIGALLGALGVSSDYNAAVQGCLLLAMLALHTLTRGTESER